MLNATSAAARADHAPADEGFGPGPGPCEGFSDSAPERRAPDPFASAGDKLRFAREDRGLTLQAASAGTRIKADFLEAIEAMDPRGLPSKAYTLGYLRAYGAFLGLEVCALVEQFKSEVECDQGRDKPTAPTRRRKIKLPKGLLGAVLILGAVGAATSWYGVQAAKTGAYADSPESETRAQVEPEIAARAGRSDPMAIWAGLPSSAAPNAMAFTALAPVSLEVRDASGRILFSRELPAGETYQAPGEPGLEISVSDAGAIAVMSGGTRIGPLGRSGQPIENLAAAEFVVSALNARLLADASSR